MIPSVADIPIAGPFSVVDIDTGRTLHTYTDGPGDIAPDVSFLPVVSVTASAGRVIISTRAPAPISPAEKARREREQYLRTLSAPFTPGTRRMY